MSLGVGVEDSMDTPLLNTVKWVNGLAFFKQCEQTPVIFKWPRMWAEEPIDSLLGTSPRAKLVHPRDHACSNNQSQTGVTA
jgi:hypothetical protein